MTRTLAIALAALVGTASVAAADSYFTIIDAQGDSAILELGTVVSEAPGTVEIYQGEQLIGMTSLNAGANSNVRVNVGSPPVRSLTAVLTSGGQVLDQQRIDVR